MQLSKIDFMRR